MCSSVRRFCIDEQGQSLVEYSLAVAFIVLAVVCLANGYHAGIGGVTSVTTTTLASAHGALPQIASGAVGGR